MATTIYATPQRGLSIYHRKEQIGHHLAGPGFQYPLDDWVALGVVFGMGIWNFGARSQQKLGIWQGKMEH